MFLFFEYFAKIAFSAISSISPVNNIEKFLYLSLHTNELLLIAFSEIILSIHGQRTSKNKFLSIFIFCPASTTFTFIFFFFTISINFL